MGKELYNLLAPITKIMCIQVEKSPGTDNVNLKNDIYNIFKIYEK